jgi:hypothetical protein
MGRCAIYAGRPDLLEGWVIALNLSVLVRFNAREHKILTYPIFLNQSIFSDWDVSRCKEIKIL